MNTAENTLELVTRPSGDDVRGTHRLRLVSRTVNVDVLRERFEDFMSKLQSLVEAGREESGPFVLEEIEFTAEITANGDFKLMGTGVGVEAKSGVTFLLRRRRAVVDPIVAASESG